MIMPSIEEEGTGTTVTSFSHQQVYQGVYITAGRMSYSPPPQFQPQFQPQPQPQPQLQPQPRPQSPYYAYQQPQFINPDQDLQYLHQQYQQPLSPPQQQQISHSPPPPIFLGMSPPPSSQQATYLQQQGATDSRNVYIRNLPETCTDDRLYQMAQPYGEIESSKSIIHESTGKCKGYGFVRYQTPQEAQQAILAFSQQGFPASLARDSLRSKLKRLQDKTSANVYISNLTSEIDEAGLIELIKPYRVVSAKILRDSYTGEHKGAGFARMPDRETALLVIEKLKQIRLPDAHGPLLPRIADSDGQRRLKRQVNSDSQSDGGSVRSGAASPIMLSPVLVYSPAASPPPGYETQHHFVSGYASPVLYASPSSPPAMQQMAYFPEQQLPMVGQQQHFYQQQQSISRRHNYYQRSSNDRAVDELVNAMQDKLGSL